MQSVGQAVSPVLPESWIGILINVNDHDEPLSRAKELKPMLTDLRQKLMAESR